VLANVRVLFGLVMMRPSFVGDGAVESMLAVARLGAATDRQGAIAGREGATSDRQGATSDYQGATITEMC
jgi:hypothetical protein